MTLSRRVVQWLFGHLGLKVLSLGLALLLWMVVAGEETVERGLRVPLELQQMPAGIEVLGDIPTTVDVRVRGGSGALSRVGTGDVVAVLDLRSARSGRRLFPLTPDQVRVPFGVEVVQVTPSAVAMAFEPSGVELTLRGNREALNRVVADDIIAFIDLAGLGPGQYTLDVHADSSPEAGVTRVEPASVQVRITRGK